MYSQLIQSSAIRPATERERHAHPRLLYANACACVVVCCVGSCAAIIIYVLLLIMLVYAIPRNNKTIQGNSNK